MAQRNEQAEFIRKYITNNFGRQLAGFRSWLSGIGGQAERVEMLRGRRGDEILAKVGDVLMTEIGLGVDESPASPNSKMRRAARGVMGPSSKDAEVET